MSRDDFTAKTKRKLAQRAGGRCSAPGCDKLCWLPGTEPADVASIGVAAHICAASEGGPRFDPNQTPKERRSIQNGIFLCETHARLIDSDPDRFPVATLQQWKEQHEEQIRNSASGTLLMPFVDISKAKGLSFSATSARHITANSIGNRVEHTLIVSNNTDFEYRSLGFTVTYPEFMEHSPSVDSPPDCPTEIAGEHMDLAVHVSGSGSASIPERTHYGQFTLEAGHLLPGEKISIRIRSIPDPYEMYANQGEKIFFHVCGEVRVMRGSILERQGFTVPLSYDAKSRVVTSGDIHDSALHRNLYVDVSRF